MKNALAIAGKDLRSYFVSPIAYVLLTGFMLLGGWFFFNLLARFNLMLQMYQGFQNPEALAQLNLNEMVIAPLWHNLSIVILLLVPMITMRGFAEERRSGTYELLLTSPVTVTEIVAGKFLGTFAFMLVLLGLTAIYPALLVVYGDPEISVMLGGFLGLVLLSTAFVAIGLFTSSLTENQIIAAFSAFVILLLLYVLWWPAESVGGTLGAVLEYVAVFEHFDEMVKGVIDTTDVIYFVSLIAVAFFLTQRAVESMRWR